MPMPRNTKQTIPFAQQQLLEAIYGRILKLSIRVPFLVIGLAIAIFVGSIYTAKFIPKTFLSPQDNGEFAVAIDLPPGTKSAFPSVRASYLSARFAIQSW